MAVVRTVTAAAVLATAAVVVCGVLRRQAGVRREMTAQRLMAGCDQRDNEALRGQLEVFRRRVDVVLAERAVVAAADRALDAALVSFSIDPHFPAGGTA